MLIELHLDPIIKIEVLCECLDLTCCRRKHVNYNA